MSWSHTAKDSGAAASSTLSSSVSSHSGSSVFFLTDVLAFLPPADCTQLTAATATAMVRAIKSVTGVTPEIKWPNDLLWRGKKLAGILTEMNAELDHVRHVIIGIGIDVNQTTDDFSLELRSLATSLKLATSKSISRAELAVAALRELNHDYARILNDQFAAVASEWAAHCTTLGREVDIQMGQRRIIGRAEALDDRGALLLRSPHGRVERVVSGDVTFAG